MDYPDFKAYKKESRLINITSFTEMPEFSGIMRYRTTFKAESDTIGLDLGFVGKTATVWLNGKCLGARICPPYTYDIKDAVRQGENLLEVEVANTLAYKLKDDLSRYLLLPPSGLIGPVRLLCITAS